MELVAVVMGCESSKERFAACKSMLDYGFANFAVVSPQAEQEMVVPVTLGKADSVTAVPSEASTLLVDKSQVSSVNIRTELEESVTAPVSRGQRLGTMTISVGEQVLKQIPLVAETGVERLSYWDLFVRMLKAISVATP